MTPQPSPIVHLLRTLFVALLVFTSSGLAAQVTSTLSNHGDGDVSLAAETEVAVGGDCYAAGTSDATARTYSHVRARSHLDSGDAPSASSCGDSSGAPPRT